MSSHRHIERICWGVLALTLLLTALFINGERLGLQPSGATTGYEARLFDTSRVHTINIVMDNWDTFIQECTDKKYSACTVIIDNEAYKNVGIRAKGNSSLSFTQQSGSQRYSFKIEFDRYNDGKSYYGLDKLCLNNVSQDNTYMKDFLSYQLMGKFGVAAPLCSYVNITVNGEDWGLYLAVEGVEDGFFQRNYGKEAGELYKPDDQGNDDWDDKDFEWSEEDWPDTDWSNIDWSNVDWSAFEQNNGDGNADGDENGNADGGGNGAGWSEMPENKDVKLAYIDDNPSSYPNIFKTAKTKVSTADKKRLIQSLKKLSTNENLESVVDVEQVIRYFVVHNFVCNGDSYTGSIIHNYYLYEKNGRLSMIPWDYNMAFGTFDGMDFSFGQQQSGATRSVNSPIDTPISSYSSQDTRPMWDWIGSSQTYLALYHQYFEEFVSRFFSDGSADSVDQIISSTAELIAPYVEKDPTKFCTYQEFQTGVDTIRAFCRLRAESVRGQLAGTIPATTDGQTQNSSSLVDASAIQLSAMGSMDNGWDWEESGDGQAKPGRPDGPNPVPDSSQPPQASAGQEENAPSQSTAPGDEPNSQNGTQQEEHSPFPSKASRAKVRTERLALSGSSAVVLLLGLVFAFRYQRRKSGS